MNAIFNRVSVRKFVDKDVEEDKIIRMLKAAMAAPSAGNQQPWEFVVIQDKEILKKLGNCSPYAGCTGNAAGAIIPCVKKSGIVYPEYAYIDISASIENILLEAVELGLGAVWLGIAPLEERIKLVSSVLNITEDLEPFAIIPFGYPEKHEVQKNRFDENRVHYGVFR